MFGRRAKGQPDQEEEVDVDLDLEADISAVERAVENYLQNPNEGIRKELLAALEELDAQLAQGDDYRGRLVYPFAAPESSIVGATSAKLTPETLADLRAAGEALGPWRPIDQ
jgi:hypothetical protein